MTSHTKVTSLSANELDSVASITLALAVVYDDNLKCIIDVILILEHSHVSWNGKRVVVDTKQYDDSNRETNLKVAQVFLTYKLGLSGFCNLKHIWTRQRTIVGKEQPVRKRDEPNKNIRRLFGDRPDGSGRFVELFTFHNRTGLTIKESVLARNSVGIQICLWAPEEERPHKAIPKYRIVDPVFRPASEEILTAIQKGIYPISGVFAPQPFDGRLAVDDDTQLSEPLVSKQSESSVYSDQPSLVTEVFQVAPRPQLLDENVTNAELAWIERCHSLLRLPFSANGVLVSLDRVYTALTVDPTSFSERRAVFELLRRLDLERVAQEQGLTVEDVFHLQHGESIHDSYVRWQSLIPQDFHQCLQLLDRRDSNALTLGQAYRKHRCLVILGDPGSGKTTMARWLALTMSRAWSCDDEVLVDLKSVDPDFDGADSTDNSSFSLGPARFPILVTAADFEQAIAEHPKMTFFEFLGQHRWVDRTTPTFGKGHDNFGEPVPPQLRQSLIRQLIEDQEAMIIVDGLDEVSDAKAREFIRNSLSAFLREHVVSQHPTVAGGRFGNRLILTSRIAGYNLCQMDGPVTHVLVRGMGKPAQRRFIESWMSAIHDPTETDSVEAMKKSAGLLGEIDDPRKRLSDFASNPLQAGALCAVYSESLAGLPQTRGEVYELAIQRFFAVWKVRLPQAFGSTSFSELNLMEFLEDVAYWIHTEEMGGLVSQTKLKELLADAVRRMRRPKANGTTDGKKPLIDALINLLANDVGLLAPRGQDAFGFLVLSIQEYLVARRLTRGTNEEAVTLCALHLDDARFREPILMAFGHLNLHAPSRLESFLGSFIGADDAFQDILPRVALLFVSAFDDMPQVPLTLLEPIGDRLIATFAQDQGRDASPLLQKLTRQSFRKLQLLSQTITNRIFVKGLKKIGDEAIPVAVSRLLMQLDDEEQKHPGKTSDSSSSPDWFTPEIAAALEAARPHDSASQSFPIHTAFRTRCLPAFNSVHQFPMRMFLEGSTSAMEFISQEPLWLRLLITIYSGLADLQSHHLCSQYDEFVRYLQLEKNLRKQFRPQFADRFGVEDQDYSIAKHMETQLRRWKGLRQDPVCFSPSRIESDSQLTSGLQLSLSQKHAPETLIEFLVAVRDSTEIVRTLRTEAILALVALDHHETLADLRSNAAHESIIDARRILAMRLQSLGDATFRAVARMKQLLPYRLSLIAKDHRESLASSTIAVFSSSTGMGLLPEDFPSSKGKIAPAFASGYLLSHLNGSDLDASVARAERLANSESTLFKGQAGLRAVTRAMEMQREGSHFRSFRWRPPSIPPRTWNKFDIPICVFDAIAAIPPSISFLRVWLLKQILVPIQKHNSELVPEALALCVGDVGERTIDRVWGQITPELATLDRFSVRPTILDRVLELDSSYHQARGLLRLAKVWPSRRDELVMKALGMVPSVSDRHKRAQVLECVCREVDAETRTGLVPLLTSLTAEIRDPDNRARSFARLVFLVPHADRPQLLSKALDSICDLDDEVAKAELLKLLAPLCAVYTDTKQEWNLAVKTIHNPWAEAVAKTLHSPVLHELEHAMPAENLEEATIWSILSLSATLGDLGLSKFPNHQEFWLAVAEQPTLESVLALAEAGQANGLELSPVAALIMDRLIHEHRVSLLPMLFPLLDHPAPETIVIVQSWLTRPADKSSNPFFSGVAKDASHSNVKETELHTIAALLLAEISGLQPNVVAAIAEMTVDHHDRIRARACNLLHSAMVPPAKRSKPVSLLGMDVLRTMAAVELTTNDPRIKIRLQWADHSIVHDDPDSLRQWLKSYNANPTDSTVRIILQHIAAVSASVLEVFMDGVRHGKPHVQRSLLVSACRQVRQGTIQELQSNESLAEFYNALASISPEVLEGDRIHLDGRSDILSAIKGAKEPVRGRTRPEMMQHILMKYDAIGASFSSLVCGVDATTLGWNLNSIGGLLYFDGESDSYLTNAVHRVQGLDVAELTGTIVAWLESLVERGRTPVDIDFNETEWNLLLLLAGISLAAPNEFLQYVETSRVRTLMLRLAKTNSNRLGRCAAIVVLGSLIEAGSQVLNAFSRALLDTPDVVEGVYRAIKLLRRIPSEAILELIGTPETRTGLYQASAVAASSATKVLEAVGASAWIKPQLRGTIAGGIAAAIRHPLSRRMIHFGYVEALMPPPLRLEQDFYGSLIRVSRLDTGNEFATIDRDRVASKQIPSFDEPVLIDEVDRKAHVPSDKKFIHRVLGKDHASGRDAWWVIRVTPEHLAVFAAIIDHGYIDLTRYGKVLRSGFGESIPPEVLEEFGFT